MSYAIRKDGLGWRSINGQDDLDAATEIYSDVIPPPSLSQIKSEQIASLAQACQAHIYAGFISSARGTPHTYPAKDKDQVNLSGSVVESLYSNLPAGWTTPFWCADAAGVWDFRPHTAAQIQQVGADGKAAITQALIKNATLAAQVTDPSTDIIEKIQAIAW